MLHRCDGSRGFDEDVESRVMGPTLRTCMKRWCGSGTLALCLLAIPPSHAATACPPLDTLASGQQVRFELLSDKAVRQQGRPYALGFNLEWKTFQRDIWNESAQNIEGSVAEALSRWPRLVYRFPGGTVSNFLDLNLSAGERRYRPKQRAVTWDAPEGMSFGLEEYLRFVGDVDGVAWIVANVYGRLEGAEPIDVLAPRWEALAARLKAVGTVSTIELGNELYLDRYALTPEQYAERANAAAGVFRKHLPDARFVVALSDFDVRSHTKADYNRRLLAHLKIDGVQFAQHSYYDGPPGGPPVPNRLRALCDSIAQARQAGHVGAAVWVTEHARWPGGKTTDPEWKKLWRKSNNLEAAISMADYAIAAAQVPEVRGAFLHSLAGTSGPWAFFMRDSDKIVRSALAEVHMLLNSVAQAEAFPTRTITTMGGGWGSNYDSRGLLMKDAQSGIWQLIAVNRSAKPLHVNVVIPPLGGSQTMADIHTVSGATSDENNSAVQPFRLTPIETQETVVFNELGEGRVVLNPYSVTLIEFRPLAVGKSTNNP